MLNFNLPGPAMMWAVVAAVFSGTVSAFLLEPVMQILEGVFDGTVLELLFPFSVTSGLLFGALGAVVLVGALGQRTLVAGTFVVSSILGMAAAVYVAVLSFNYADQSFAVPYGVGSPVGALILAVPLLSLGRFHHPWRALGLVLVVPTLWAVGVTQFFLDPDTALAPRGLTALYVGWQVSVLMIFTAHAYPDERVGA